LRVLETGNEYGQPPVLHPFDVTPPVEAAYATQDVSAITPEQSQIVSQSPPSFQFSPQSRTPTTNTQSQYLSKVVERIFEHRIRQQIEVDDMQFGLMKGKGTTDAIFTVRQM